MDMNMNIHLISPYLDGEWWFNNVPKCKYYNRVMCNTCHIIGIFFDMETYHMAYIHTFVYLLLNKDFQTLWWRRGDGCLFLFLNILLILTYFEYLILSQLLRVGKHVFQKYKWKAFYCIPHSWTKSKIWTSNTILCKGSAFFM